MSKRRMWTKKPPARNENLIQTKNQAYNELWMDWENHLEKNPIQKHEKTVKIRVKLPHVKNHYRETEFLFKHRFLTLH